jgi:hypothetical protein
MTSRKAKPAAKPKRKPPAAVKAAVERAEARSAGKPMPEPEDPGLAADTGFSMAEMAEIAERRTRRYIAKVRMAYTPELAAEICWRMETRIWRDVRGGAARANAHVGG